MSRVFVLDAEKRPLMPCTPARARLLLTQRQAAVFRRFPFTLILRKACPDAVVQPLRVKIDPGSQTTGLAVVNDATGEVVWAAELTHRGDAVHKGLQQRAGVRRSRRQRHTRYRPPRFLNRTRPQGWLPPSLVSRLQHVETWVGRLQRWCPLGAISYEAVRFDTQAWQNPDIVGADYQHGTLAGLEVKEYLLLKWGHRCVYCGKTGLPLQVEHLIPKARHGSNRISNLTLACGACNQRKGNQTAEEFGFPQLHIQAQQPLRDAAAVNSSRRALHERLQRTPLPIEASSGGRTKWNRKERGIPKTHWLDAANVGPSTPARLHWQHTIPLLIRATGRQSRQMCRVDQYGFVRTRPKERSRIQGFCTGDMVKAVVTEGKKVGVYTGRVAVRASGFFNITTTAQGTVQGIAARYCQPIHRSDGYSYAKGEAALPPHA